MGIKIAQLFSVLHPSDKAELQQTVLAAKIKATTEKEVQLFDKKFTPLFSRLQQIIQVKEIRKTLLFPCRSTLSKFH